MNLDSNDDDSDESDFVSNAGEDADIHLNHYRVSNLLSYGPYGSSNGEQQTGNGGSKSKSMANLKQVKFSCEGKIMSLYELAAQKVACYFPFGLVERYDQPVPEPMQCRIAYWSFPQDEEDVKLYTCLANGNADYFYKAEELLFQNAVRDMLQVGFHLSANVVFMNSDTERIDTFNVALTFDRRRITTCSCTCSTATFWCQHVVAVCLQRIRKPQEAKLRAPVSESLQRLEKDQLQKFAQYLINELPQQILPAAQKLLDELLSGDEAHINRNPAAPDPTAGALLNEHTSWCLDYTHLSQDIRRILIKQCTAQPTVCSDIQSLHATAPPATTEYTQLLRPIRGREPEGIWNLISIVGEMMKRRDPNLFPLLEIMTDEIMKCEKIVTWWFETKVSLHSGSTIHFANIRNSQCTSQYSCSNFCDEIVHLWRLAALNPSSTPIERNKLYRRYYERHLSILKRHVTLSENNGGQSSGLTIHNIISSNKANKRNFLELFPGFKSAMEACQIDWSDWDEKRGELVSVMNVEHGEKRNKHKQKRKRRSKSKQNTTQAAPADMSNLTTPIHRNDDPLVAVDELEGTLDDDDNPAQSSVSGGHMYAPESATDAKHQDSNLAKERRHDDPNTIDSTNTNPPEDSASQQSASKSFGAHCPEPDDAEQEDSDEDDDERYPDNEIQMNEANNERQPENQPNRLRDEDMEPELQVYFMDEQPEVKDEPAKTDNYENLIKLNNRKLADPLEILYSKIEGLHAHGHLEEARRLARRLASEILGQRNYPSLKQLFLMPRRRKKKGSLDNQMSIVASETLIRIHFLCNLLHDDIDNHCLIFKLVMFGVELKRSPAATKPLEVKLISQKQELISLLKSIVLSDNELEILRDKARLVRENPEDNPIEPLTALILGNFIFETFVLSRSCNKLPSDSSLGFQTALSALGFKINVLESDHPLLCEGVRRQRGELALSMILHFKDDQEKLDMVLKQLLDQDLIECNKTATGIAVTDQSSTTVQPSRHKSPAAHSIANSTVRAVGSHVSAKANTPTTQEANQPSEAGAHFMFELAITIFDKAGGNSTTAHLFRPQVLAQNGSRGIHRRLHMCTLRIALYALGLQNRTSSNWMERTYSGRASFIQNQALEVGLPAIKFLYDNWDGYLTPVEAASVADKAGCSNDVETKRIAAEMAKSCLKYAHCLNFNTVTRILVQCKEQTIEMFEEACTEIEQAAEAGNVCPDVLFVTARAWHCLYLKLSTDDHNHCSNVNLYQLNNLVTPSMLGSGLGDQPNNGEDLSPIVEWLPGNQQQAHLFQACPMQQEYVMMAQPQHVSSHMLGAHSPTLVQSSQGAQTVAVRTGANQAQIPAEPAKLALHQQQQQQQQQQIEHQLTWDVYSKADFILTSETPTFMNIDYVRSAFRVGIKAMDSIKLPAQAGAKHNPKKLDEILWLLGISKSLGRDYLFKFSRCVIKNITDPNILQDIFMEIISFFEFIKLPQDHPDRANILEPILDKCLENCERQVKDLVKHTSYDQKLCIESIFEVVQKLTRVVQTPTTAQYYRHILTIAQPKNDNKRNCRRSRNHIDVISRLNWIIRWAIERFGMCLCDKCWDQIYGLRFSRPYR